MCEQKRRRRIREEEDEEKKKRPKYRKHSHFESRERLEQAKVLKILAV